MATIAERVARGAALLDEREPGWWQRIDLDRLDLGSPCRCVLGQLITDKDPQPPSLWIEILGWFGIRSRSDVSHGFNTYGPGTDAQYRHLTAAWRNLIEVRRIEADRAGEPR
jgi:hypothetical protein